MKKLSSGTARKVRTERAKGCTIAEAAKRAGISVGAAHKLLREPSPPTKARAHTPRAVPVHIDFETGDPRELLQRLAADSLREAEVARGAGDRSGSLSASRVASTALAILSRLPTEERGERWERAREQAKGQLREASKIFRVYAEQALETGDVPLAAAARTLGETILSRAAAFRIESLD